MKRLLYVLILFPLFTFKVQAAACLENNECLSGQQCQAFQCVAKSDRCIDEFQCVQIPDSINKVVITN